MYNIYAFLIVQKKWKVFPLTLFYTLALSCLVFRCVDTMLTVQIAANFNIFGTLMPAMLKICIGLVQAEVITELIMRVE